MQIADKKFLGTATKTLEKKIHLCSIWDCAKLKQTIGQNKLVI